ncbi:MAG: sigma-70 family RNA polymerase sigma factor [Candidatus Cybelea sp.]
MALRFRATPLRRPIERDRYIVEYWYLCRRAARRFVRRGLDRADLEQVGAIGLIKAADRYDPGERAPFEAYAWLLIVGELMHYVRDSERFLRAPRGVRDLERRWNAAERELSARWGRLPSESDVASFVAATPAQAREIRAYRASSRMISFELLKGREDCVPPAGIDDLLDRLTVERMLLVLPPLERRIIEAIHLGGATVVELAARLGYSRRHVSRLHRAAMERLRTSTLASRRQGRR